jgi:hypothetical protein
MQVSNRSRPAESRSPRVWYHAERPLNWLALGLLLAAWNAADDDADRRPAPLRGYPVVSVRAIERCASLPR